MQGYAYEMIQYHPLKANEYMHNLTGYTLRHSELIEDCCKQDTQCGISERKNIS